MNAEISPTVERPFAPLPLTLDLDPHLVDIGRRLFTDTRVSGPGDRACSDCHDLAQGGVVPGEARSNHPMNETGPYNVPTVFNVAFNFRFNWTGKFESLEDHVAGPMMSERVMDAGSWPELVVRLDDRYREAYIDAGYAEGVTQQGVQDALAVYQRSLITPNALFDRYMRGDADLAPDQARGLELFVDIGCASCHQGKNIGGNMFQRFGVVADAFDRPIVRYDLGRQRHTGLAQDAHVFRVPSLRNVEITGPYFHDGSRMELSAAVQHMARVQLGYELTEDETADIVAFLHTLTGEFEGISLSPSEPAP